MPKHCSIMERNIVYYVKECNLYDKKGFLQLLLKEAFSVAIVRIRYSALDSVLIPVGTNTISDVETITSYPEPNRS